MRKFFTLLLFGLSMLAWPAMAQDVDESYMFMDEDGNIIENGATVVRNIVETESDGGEVIYSGVSVLNLSGTADDFIKMHYIIERIDNGTYQICFPMSCNMQTAVGSYETGIGQLMGDLQDIQSEWFPTDDGECVVTLSIEIFTKKGGFPPSYVHKANGPTITLRFVKGDTTPVIDESFMFMDEDGNIIENGATVVREVVETDDDGADVIYSGLSVINLSGTANDFIKMHYVIDRIDNGSYQICFPMSCNMQTDVGSYETGIGQLMGDLQDIQSEWFPAADGECDVTLTIELFVKMGGFPPSYIHKADGPTIHLRFIKGGAPEPIKGDVNGDGEVNISDVNAIIRMILGTPEDKGDVNRDGEVNISDVNVVIGIILNNA